ncbi:MAG: hypothetical protein ABFD86_09675 [Bryobacteraceae bacterium]
MRHTIDGSRQRGGDEAEEGTPASDGSHLGCGCKEIAAGKVR